MRRCGGILLHPTSLAGSLGIGDLGDVAVDWLDFLVATETTLWQVLPLGPTGYGNSPYQSYSSLAGNPLLIDPRGLAREGLLDRADVARLPALPPGRVDYEAVRAAKRSLLGTAYASFTAAPGLPLRSEFEQFRAENDSWLTDFALFMAVKEAHDGRSWADWPQELREREPTALAAAATRLSGPIDFHRFVQFLFFRQWKSLRRRAADRAIRIIGDLPMYVAWDSVDVWLHPHLFRLDARGRPAAVAGVPPDSFSATGQLWGNPLYAWEAHAAEGYAWWIDRFRAVTGRFDVVRIDHFRAFADYWEIPRGSETAEVGKWRIGPGRAVFDAVTAALGDLDLIAEDLGDLSPRVPRLRRALGLPGMKLLQDAFARDETHEFLPHNYPTDCVAYTGTHDNNTCIGWYEQAPASDRAFARRYLDWDGADPAWTMIRAVWESRAAVAIAPAQDFLRLSPEARMNTPGTAEGNWEWRMQRRALTPTLIEAVRRLNRETGRSSRLPACGRRLPDDTAAPAASDEEGPAP